MAGFLGPNVPVWDAAPLYDTLKTPISKRDMLVNNIPLGESLAAQFASQPDSTSQKSSGQGDEPSKDDDGSQTHSNPAQTVVLMRRHGFTVQADSIEMAVYRGIYTKINAKAQTDSMAVARHWGGSTDSETDIASGLGLTDELVQGCTEMNERFQEKPWRLWVREVEGRGIYVNRLA